MPPKGWKKSTSDNEEGKETFVPMSNNVVSEVKHALVFLDRRNNTAPDLARFSAPDLNKFINGLISEGWHILHTEVTETNPEAIGILYIFAK